MPIQLGVKTTEISHDDYHTIDYEVMGIVFSIHRESGRFWNEKIYQNELAYRCQKAGLKDVATEVPIYVSYKDFIKTYSIDLLINNVIFELKAAQNLTGEHKKQIINYLMLTGLNHAKLINLRPSSVLHRFVTTNITANNGNNSMNPVSG
ncbi:GxxExxY protein [Candidatus Saccharibacteria bacterium]|nr:GxxExxY protein [Candidatus Saccharibacteria bacterium]NIV04189.1 GxxExxY protein [Calditrichia bacterium]NIV72628.1 GxxExxY protein [Calditrichia bacterium]NIV99763.1 GxxExxY protein [Candidatus Saccharibacteria bacterium]NIW80126.1 GxxExxY protein [Calditrichia bacterium]